MQLSSIFKLILLPTIIIYQPATAGCGDFEGAGFVRLALFWDVFCCLGDLRQGSSYASL